mgnify:CR=1 FL=1
MAGGLPARDPTAAPNEELNRTSAAGFAWRYRPCSCASVLNEFFPFGHADYILDPFPRLPCLVAPCAPRGRSGVSALRLASSL